MIEGIHSTIAILERLVAFPTVSRDSNLQLIDFVRDFLVQRGAVVDVFPRPDGTKASLYAKLGQGGGGILLSGHTDVVPIDGQIWSSEPFRLSERSGRLYGRGAADMKGFLACMLALVDRVFQKTEHAPLHLAFSYDEEVGCKGVGSLLDRISLRGDRPNFCIVGEPSAMDIIVAHKGKIALNALCRGAACHSSRPADGVNAIYLAMDLIALLRSMQLDIQRLGPRDAGFDVPHSTVSVGKIRGGTALNIVAQECSLDFEIRHIADDPVEKYLILIEGGASAISGVQAGRFPGVGIALTIKSSYPPLNTDAEVASVVAAQRLIEGATIRKASFGSEAGLFAELGLFPVIICGPGRIEEAHRPDEFIYIEQLARCSVFLDRVVTQRAIPI